MKRLHAFLLIIPMLGLIGCGSSSDKTVTETQTVIIKETGSSVGGQTQSPVPQQPSYPGDPGTTDYPKGTSTTVGSHTETVIDVVYPYEGKYYRDKQPRSTFIKVTVKISNTSDHPIDYNPNFYKLEDSQKVNINYGSFQLSDPLSSGTLPIGGELVGSMAYEIPAGAEPVALLAEQGFKLPPTRFSVR